MSDLPLIQAVKQSDHKRASELLEQGHDIHERGECDWAALHFAAGNGDLQMVELLIERGADVFLRGRDNRTAYKIALAASHTGVARRLTEQEEATGGDTERISSREWETRPYCRAYPLEEVRRYSLWTERSSPKAGGPKTGAAPDDAAEEDLVFIHEDYWVTASIWRDRDVLLTGDSPGWREFCELELGFRVPRDLE